MSGCEPDSWGRVLSHLVGTGIGSYLSLVLSWRILFEKWRFWSFSSQKAIEDCP